MAEILRADGGDCCDRASGARDRLRPERGDQLLDSLRRTLHARGTQPASPSFTIGREKSHPRFRRCVDHPEGDHRVRTGTAPNELTASEDRDPWVGTPWHKSVAARLEAVS